MSGFRGDPHAGVWVGLVGLAATWTFALPAAANPQGAVEQSGVNASAASQVRYPRDFSRTSWWNTPLGDAPADSHSQSYMNDSQRTSNTQDYLKLVAGDFASPVFWAQPSDPLYTIRPGLYGVSVQVHIPLGAAPQPSTDSELTVYDESSDQVVGLWHAAFAHGTWTADGVDRYYLSSDGISQQLGGRTGNSGHRGLPAAMRAVQMRQVQAGAIDHRLVVSWHATAGRTPEGASAYWPMSQSEQGRGGVVPEGIVIRIKPSVDLSKKGLSPAALVVATALQDYGAVVGDNSGSGNNLKLQQNASWGGVLSADSLKSIPWSDWMFVKGGYRPQGGARHKSTCHGVKATLVGTSGADVLKGTAARDVIAGGGGADVIRGGDGNDLICGANGRDRIWGGMGGDSLGGGRGVDRLVGGPAHDTLRGAGGADRIMGGRGGDDLRGGSFGDRLRGGRGDDRLAGGPGRDRLTGGYGHDRLLGRHGADYLEAVDAAPGDTLRGSTGADVCLADPGDHVMGCRPA